MFTLPIKAYLYHIQSIISCLLTLIIFFQLASLMVTTRADTTSPKMEDHPAAETGTPVSNGEAGVHIASGVDSASPTLAGIAGSANPDPESVYPTLPADVRGQSASPTGPTHNDELVSPTLGDIPRPGSAPPGVASGSMNPRAPSPDEHDTDAQVRRLLEIVRAQQEQLDAQQLQITALQEEVAALRVADATMAADFQYRIDGVKSYSMRHENSISRLEGTMFGVPPPNMSRRGSVRGRGGSPRRDDQVGRAPAPPMVSHQLPIFSA